MRAALVLLALAASPAFADDTFEAKASGAQRVAHVDDLVWAFATNCDAGDDTQQRQCRRLRDTRQAQLANATVIVDAEKDAFTVGAWNAKTKSVPLTLNGCVACGGIEVDGKKWFVGNAKDKLHDNAKTAADENAAKAFTKLTAGARVQLIVKLAAKPKLVVDGKNVLGIEVVGYRVFNPCDGTIIIANPASAPVEANKKACPKS
jgi:hypothetical protein